MKEFDPQETISAPILDAQYFEQTDFFFTSDEKMKLKVYKISGTIVTPFSWNQELDFIHTIKPIPFTNKLFVGTNTYAAIRTSSVLNCHEFCRECDGITPFSCTACYAGYTLGNYV